VERSVHAGGLHASAANEAICSGNRNAANAGVPLLHPSDSGQQQQRCHRSKERRWLWYRARPGSTCLHRRTKHVLPAAPTVAAQRGDFGAARRSIHLALQQQPLLATAASNVHMKVKRSRDADCRQQQAHAGIGCCRA
jgi:hypothetical protein